MAADDAPLDDKAKRMRDLLSSFYSTDQSSVTNSNAVSSKYATLDTINSPSFDPDHYMNLLVQKSNLETLLQRHVEMAAEIKNLDTDLQMLVYENYNKFISATETIKRMNSNIVGMETNMEQLLEKILSVQSRSDGVNTSLFEKREHIEKLHRTRNLLRKIQFIYDLPERLGKCIKSEAYTDAVKFYTGAMPIFKAYGDSSFQDCKKASEEAVSIIIKNLQGKLFSDSESIQVRAEAVMLLKQLDFPVDNLKDQLFEKLEQSLGDVQLHLDGKIGFSAKPDDSAKQELPNHIPAAHEVSTRELVEAVRAYRVIFPNSEQQLIRISHDLVIKHFESVDTHIKSQISSAQLLDLLKLVWADVLMMDEVLPEASVADVCLEAANHAVKQYITGAFSHLLQDISDSLMKIQINQKETVKEEHPLQAILEASKKAVIQGSMGVLLDFRQLLDDSLPLLNSLRDLVIDWVQEGFQAFFRTLYNRFLLLSGKNNPTSQDLVFHDSMQGDKTVAGLVLVLAQLSVFIDQNAIPRITEEIATSFSSGGVRGYESGPAFVPAEICRIYRSAAEKFLHLYINMKTQRVSVLLKKRFTTPNWIKHKEPREVHMFVDLFLQELEGVLSEVKQLLPEGPTRKHRRADSMSNGSTTSSRSNPLRDDRLLARSNTQKARSQLLETHLAKLFKQKMEIFTKVDATQDSVLTTIVKLCLKSLQEFVRLQTFNRSGFQQIQLDTQFLRNSIKDSVEDEAAVDFLLDEVIVAAVDRCMDPTPLEPAVLDRLVQVKLEKPKQQTSTSQ
ncbi:vacuolar protein sorting-associated protein 51 homolog [Beta vulgaris subsp. vulgaris]|uniref:vacuolar protein sorting-associated protein 51 homolog n=1 Tax=Beta vulgaris subsp. vulgaris TaxID=3555 RepID=UPI00203708BC|nr:vacuolar protein sorting-associated protein 51 homolog [Beta vulgaris subsp. vulgaris]